MDSDMTKRAGLTGRVEPLRLSETPETMFTDLPEGIQTILERLETAGYEAWLAGGCVRDALCGRTPHDYDIATSASPQQVQDLFSHTAPTGIEHGTVTVFEQGEQAEVTTFRKEGRYSDHRHPDQVEFVTDLFEDLSRRDFTINAMAWNPRRGLVDLFGGRDDLRAGIIRAVGDPLRRFEEDALRMFRAFRFAGRYGFEIEEKTRQAIEDKSDLSAQIAVERIVPEVEQIMERSPQILDQMTRLLQPWIPELEIMKNTPQNSIYHYTDVLHHTLDALEALPEYDRACAWALLLHDSGKPDARVFYNGHDHFTGHAERSAEIAAWTVDKLKLPRKLGDQIVRLVRFHDTFYAPRLLNLYKLRVRHRFDDESVEKLFQVQYSDIQAHTIHDRMKSLEAFQEFYEREKNRHPLSVHDLQINGNDARAIGLQGPAIAQALNAVLKEVIVHDERCADRPSQLDLLAQEAAAIQSGQTGADGKKKTSEKEKRA